MPYEPKPVDTSGIRLTPELEELTEELAENTHEIWASQRVRQGWRHGPVRNDERRETPDLVPYKELPETEKEYDRRTALETVRFLLARGYSITAPPGASVAGTTVAPAAEREIARCREALTREPALSTIAGLLAERDPDLWRDAPELYVLAGEAALRMGEPLIAFDLLKEGLRDHPAHVRLRQLEALALARSGASAQATRILTGLVEEGHRDAETLSILARTYKDLGQPAESFRIYEDAWESTGEYYPGINAATLAAVLGQDQQAKTIARKVRETILAKPAGDYWETATLGEAALILGDWREAEDRYAGAVRQAGRAYGDINATRGNARLILNHVRPAPSETDRQKIEECFGIPNVVLFAGHMIDQPGREQPRFPPELEPVVRQQLRSRLKALNAGFGYSAAACGSDILFAEVMLELGNELQIVLPYEKEKFIEDSVDVLPGWKERFEAVIRKASGVTIVADRQLTRRGVEFEYSNLYVFGMALARARQLDTSLKPLTVWDGKPGDGPGGTGWAVSRWREYGLPVEVISLGDGAVPAVAGKPGAQGESEIRGLLFGDAVGFSKLPGEQVPLFAKHFLGLIAELADKDPPLFCNTWGDGIYLVFRNVREAGVFALNVCERVAATNWGAKGLRDLNLRIGVHAGPVYEFDDPLSKRKNYIGSHVSRAARIEPVTPPGQVYASQAFAAIAAVDRVTDFSCDYVGRIGMAKGYGTFPTYVVRR